MKFNSADEFRIWNEMGALCRCKEHDLNEEMATTKKRNENCMTIV